MMAIEKMDEFRYECDICAGSVTGNTLPLGWVTMECHDGLGTLVVCGSCLAEMNRKTKQ